jgi:hypothetical protein
VKKGAGTQNFQPNYLAERLATVGNEAKKAKHALRELAGRSAGSFNIHTEARTQTSVLQGLSRSSGAADFDAK